MTDIYRRIKARYAPCYGVSASTLFLVRAWSLSGASAWMEINGEVRCIPRICIVDSAPFDYMRARPMASPLPFETGERWRQ